ncbi:MAG: DUF4157 domain-containing protein, partial [Spirulina sp. SIO3F2]|nr:DUF4157 domain-containing protein [Spirulina sp. SIO3F2]
MASRSQVSQKVSPSVQRRAAQVAESKKKPLFEPPRGFGYDGPEPPQFANLPSGALMPKSILESVGSEATTPVQAKLTVGAANDCYEQEADKVARQVVQEIRTPKLGMPPTEDEDSAVQRQVVVPKVQLRAEAGESMAAPDAVERGINQARGQGQPLGDTVREPMERAFGTDFGGVRVHTDARADALSQSIQAKAFTTGQDVFFRAGAYQPGSQGGQALLAHELTHVVQQEGSEVHRTSAQIQRALYKIEQGQEPERIKDKESVKEEIHKNYKEQNKQITAKEAEKMADDMINTKKDRDEKILRTWIETKKYGVIDTTQNRRTYKDIISAWEKKLGITPTQADTSTEEEEGSEDSYLPPPSEPCSEEDNNRTATPTPPSDGEYIPPPPSEPYPGENEGLSNQKAASSSSSSIEQQQSQPGKSNLESRAGQLAGLAMKQGTVTDIKGGEGWKDLVAKLTTWVNQLVREDKVRPDGYAQLGCIEISGHDGQVFTFKKDNNPMKMGEELRNEVQVFLHNFMEGNGQLKYITDSSWYQNGTAQVEVDVNFYADRPYEETGLGVHKDTGGSNLFVNLIFANESEVPATEWTFAGEKPSEEKQKRIAELMHPNVWEEIEQAREIAINQSPEKQTKI